MVSLTGFGTGAINPSRVRHKPQKVASFFRCAQLMWVSSHMGISGVQADGIWTAPWNLLWGLKLQMGLNVEVTYGVLIEKSGGFYSMRFFFVCFLIENAEYHATRQIITFNITTQTSQTIQRETLSKRDWFPKVKCLGSLDHSWTLSFTRRKKCTKIKQKQPPENYVGKNQEDINIA